MGDDDGTVMRRSRRRMLPLVAMVLSALVVGLVGGYVLRTATEPAVAPLAPPNASPAPPVAPTESPPVSSPCIAVAERGDDLLVELERAVRAIAALDPGALRAVVDEVERLRAEMQRAVDACEGRAGPAPGAGTAPPTAVVPSTPG